TALLPCSPSNMFDKPTFFARRFWSARLAGASGSTDSTKCHLFAAGGRAVSRVQCSISYNNQFSQVRHICEIY
uniref:hypothetical protein n=1 Tax=Candidatus Scatomorpha intestinigallinarum TaxID=2840923 RepID=UPI004028F5B6